MDKLVTVIVPVYNASNYIDCCVNSILNQSYKNLEVILVNDGSKDNSLEKCLNLSKIDSRIKVIDQENKGCSAARNAAIDIATGDYFVFIDSDDFVHTDYVNYLLKLCETNLCKVSQISYKYVDANATGCKFEQVDYCETVWNFADLFTSKSRDYKVIACGKMYAKELFNDYRFVLGMINEDEDSTFRLLYNAGRITTSTRVMYFYRMSDNSIMRKKRTSINKNFIVLHKGLISFLEEKGEDLLLRFERKELCLKMIRAYIGAKRDKMPKSECNRLFLEYKEQYKLIKSFKGFSTKESGSLIAFRIAPNLFAMFDNKTNIIKKSHLKRTQKNNMAN